MDSTIHYDIRQTYRCPCGKGEYLYEAVSNDWGPPKAKRHMMLCSKCKDKYLYDRRIVGGHFDGTTRGWVLREHLKVEQRYVKALRRYQRSIMVELEKRCRAIWKNKLAACRTKKAVWEIAEDMQAYSTFLSHHRQESMAKLIAMMSKRRFHFFEVGHVLKVCGIAEPPERLTSMAKPTAPHSLPESLRDMAERYGADTQQMYGPPSLD